MFYANTEQFVVSNIEERHEKKIKEIAKILFNENLCDALAINRGVHAYLTAGNHKVSETVDEFCERRKQNK
jgi:hypothetical protein